MSRSFTSRFGWVLLLTIGAATFPALAQAPPSASTGAYRPGLGDLMTMTVQPRHLKLWLGASQKNWRYAAYELHELQEAFDRVAAVWPTWQSQPIAPMIGFNVRDPMAKLAAAIKAKDSAAFAAGYKQLSEACNTCHQGAGREMVVIRIPDASMFPDQDFSLPPP